MHFRDLDIHTPGVDNVAPLMHAFDCDVRAAREILAEVCARHSRGDSGQTYHAGLGDPDRARLAAMLADDARFAGVDARDLADLLLDAWEEGLTRKDRVVVCLDNSTCDAVCGGCGSFLANGAESCEGCGSRDVDQQVTVTVSDDYAVVWAKCDQTIDGSSWEEVGNGEVYTILSTRPGLAAELRAEGYRLDLSNYTCDDTPPTDVE